MKTQKKKHKNHPRSSHPFSTHFPTPGEVRETRRNLVTGRSSPRLKTMVELVLQSTFRILDERFEYSFSVENEERK